MSDGGTGSRSKSDASDVRVTVRYFAILRETVGRGEEVRDVALGTSVGELFDRVARDHPRLRAMKPATLLMVNQSYVPASRPLADGDEVAFIPPVSGGSADSRYRVQTEQLDPRAVERQVEAPEVGAIVTFVGRVRNQARGRAVVALDYEAYPPAAERMLEQIGREIAERWDTDRVAIAHRTGFLRVGEVSVVIAVAAAHREAAFAASKYAIERIKEVVPIWKKEHYEDGAVWVGSEAEYQRTIERAEGSVAETPAEALVMRQG